MAAVMIGVDPHKGSHTAVAISAAEEPLGQLRVRACAAQAGRLLEWAQAWPERTWAVEGADGTGHLLASSSLSAGERVLDVQPKLGARVRLLAAGDVNKNDPNDARSVAVAALRSPGVRQARPDDHAAVLKIWSKRHRDLSRARTQVACRLHAVLCELVPGGVTRHITAGQAMRVLAAVMPPDTASAARCELAAAFTEDLRRIDAQLRETRKKLQAAVRASGTSMTGLFGVGPVTAATVIGDVRHVSRFPGRDHFAAAGTALRRSRSPPVPARSTGSAGAATGGSTTRSTYAIYAALLADARRAAAQTAPGGPGRATGDGSVTSAAGSHPQVPALRESHSRASRQPTSPPATPADPAPALSRTAADPGERAGGSRTGCSPAAQRRPKGVLDAPARAPIMPGSGKEAASRSGTRGRERHL